MLLTVHVIYVGYEYEGRFPSSFRVAPEKSTDWSELEPI